MGVKLEKSIALGTCTRNPIHNVIIYLKPGWRALWCGKNERIASCGYTKGAEREIALWDPRALAKALNVTKLDNSPAAFLPFVRSLIYFIFIIYLNINKKKASLSIDKPCNSIRI